MLVLKAHTHIYTLTPPARDGGVEANTTKKNALYANTSNGKAAADATATPIGPHACAHLKRASPLATATGGDPKTRYEQSFADGVDLHKGIPSTTGLALQRSTSLPLITLLA